MIGPEISTRQLRYFVAVVDWGSISQAASELGIAPPAIGQQVADLEAKVGTSLITRTPRGVTPTEAGTRIYAHARSILRQIGELAGIAETAGAEPAGTVNVGLTSSVSARLSVELFGICRQRFPKIDLTLFDAPGNIMREQVIGSRLDFAFVFEDTPIAGLGRRKICRHRLFAVGARQATDPKGDQPFGAFGPQITVETLATRDLLFAAGGAAMQGALMRAFRQRRLEPRGIGATSSLLGALAVANLGLAVIVLPLGNPIPGDDRTNLVYLPIEPALWLNGSMIVNPMTPLGPAAAAIHDLIVDLIGGHVSSGRWTGCEMIDSPSA